MKKRKYLPVWTDGLTYCEQHFVYWISQNMERIDDRYSFLPIRILGDFFCDRKRFNRNTHWITDYFEKGTCTMKGTFVPISYPVAEKAFDLAANEFFEKHPEALEITFGKQNFNGVYDAEYPMEYETRLKVFQEILDKKIEELCVLDETFEYRKEDNGHYAVNAIIDINENDIQYGLPKFLSSRGFPYKPKTVNVKKEDIYSHYSFVPEKIFNLANQYVKYEQNSKDLADFFKAAKDKNLDLIKKYVHDGVSINSIDRYGYTALSNFIISYDLETEQRYDDDLKAFIDMGANPAIYGVGEDVEPLSDASLGGNIAAVSFLLESGVSPNIFPCIDEPWEMGRETLIERTARWAEGDLNIDSDPDETQRKILNLLLQHVNYRPRANSDKEVNTTLKEIPQSEFLKRANEYVHQIEIVDLNWLMDDNLLDCVGIVVSFEDAKILIESRKKAHNEYEFVYYEYCPCDREILDKKIVSTEDKKITFFGFDDENRKFPVLRFFLGDRRLLITADMILMVMLTNWNIDGEWIEYENNIMLNG